MEEVIMSYTSKRNIVSTFAGIALIVAYVIYAMGANAPATEDIKAWAVTILVFIGIGVGIQIVVQIIFHVALAIGIAVKEELKAGGNKGGETAERIIKSEMVEDEWSKLITLKSERVAFIIASFGFAAGLLILAIGFPVVIALHLTAGSFAAGTIIEGITGVIYHERGVHNS
jgi:hypothetical protein